jgi:hypothetical protein
MLYRRKKHLINSHILNLTFSLVISDDFSKEQAIITNVKGFESLLCELEVLKNVLKIIFNKKIYFRYGMKLQMKYKDLYKNALTIY